MLKLWTEITGQQTGSCKILKRYRDIGLKGVSEAFTPVARSLKKLQPHREQAEMPARSKRVFRSRRQRATLCHAVF